MFIYMVKRYLMGFVLSPQALNWNFFKIAKEYCSAPPKKRNSDQFLQLSDFEFTPIDIENSLILIAVCKGPRIRNL